MKFSELSKQYMDSVTFAQLEERTRQGYRNWLRRIPDEAAESPAALFRFFKDLPTKAITKNLGLIPVRAVYAWAVSHDIIPASQNIGRSFKNFRSEIADPEPGLTIEQVKDICAQAKTPTQKVMAHFLTVLFWTGARPSEILNLNWNDIDFKKGLIAIRGAKRREKGVISRYCNLLPQIIDALDDLRKATRPESDDSPLFTGQAHNDFYGKRISSRMSRRHFAGMAKRAGVKASLRLTRPGLATTMLQDGYTITDVQYTLGHSSINTTQRYLRVTKADKAKIFTGLKKAA